MPSISMTTLGGEVSGPRRLGSPCYFTLMNRLKLVFRNFKHAKIWIPLVTRIPNSKYVRKIIFGQLGPAPKVVPRDRHYSIRTMLKTYNMDVSQYHFGSSVPICPKIIFLAYLESLSLAESKCFASLTLLKVGFHSLRLWICYKSKTKLKQNTFYPFEIFDESEINLNSILMLFICLIHVNYFCYIRKGQSWSEFFSGAVWQVQHTKLSASQNTLFCCRRSLFYRKEINFCWASWMLVQFRLLVMLQ